MSMVSFLSLFLVFIFFSLEGKFVFFVSGMMLLSALYSENLLSFGFFMDFQSYLMCLLTLLISSILSLTFKEELKMHINYIMCFLIVTFFFTDSVTIFFVCFELSLIPLLVLVICWGQQAERLKAGRFMMMYTIIFSSPFLLFLIFSSKGSIFLLGFSKPLDMSLFVFSLFAFLVKIPVFFFHSWLPKAHVEAPLEGSMLLAGLMLKVGVYGFIRIFYFVSLSGIVIELMFSISFVGAMISGLMSLSSDDMKMSVALSSVSHMNFVFSALLTLKSSALGAVLIVLLAHGLSSPMLFYLVTKIYLSSHSRSLLISKGVLSKIPFYSFMSFLLWSMNLAVPPFFPFLGEVLSIVAILSFFIWGVSVVILFFIINSFFSMLNYGIVSHSSFKLLSKIHMSDFYFYMCSFVSLTILFMLFFFYEVLA
nr:NADH dehydrogenase subunit 4 [Pessoaiella absita]